MSENELAMFRTSTGKMKRLLEDSALSEGNEPFHSDLYLEVHSDRIEVIVAKSNNSVLTNCTFTGTYFDELELNADEPFGAILNVERTQDYLDIADTDGTLEIEFLGSEDNDLAQSIRISGGLNTKWKLPTAQEILDRIPLQLPERFNGEDQFLSSDGKTHTSSFKTTMATLQKIHDAVELDSEVDFYPITIEEDGNGDPALRLELGKEGDGESDRTAVWGELEYETCESEEESLKNYYNTGFDPVIDSLSGSFRGEVSPNAPLSIVQNSGEDKTIRHVLSPVEQTN